MAKRRGWKGLCEGWALPWPSLKVALGGDRSFARPARDAGSAAALSCPAGAPAPGEAPRGCECGWWRGQDAFHPWCHSSTLATPRGLSGFPPEEPPPSSQPSLLSSHQPRGSPKLCYSSVLSPFNNNNNNNNNENSGLKKTGQFLFTWKFQVLGIQNEFRDFTRPWTIQALSPFSPFS